MPNQDTDSRREAQPMTPEQLAALRLFLDDEFAGVTCHWPMTALRSNDRTLADRDHWREMYQQGLDANMDLVREVQLLNARIDAVEGRTRTNERKHIFGRVEFRLDPSGYDPKRDGGADS